MSKKEKVIKFVTLKKGDFIETKPVLISKSKNLYKDGIKGYIVSSVMSSDIYIWIIPSNDDLLKNFALTGHPTGVPRGDIIKVNGMDYIGSKE